MKKLDTQFQDHTIVDVTTNPSGTYVIRNDEGWSLQVPADSPVAPKVGSSVRYYGRGIGFPVRGLDIDGVEVWYRSDAEERAKFDADQAERKAAMRRDYEAHAEEYARDIQALPTQLQWRFVKFQHNNPDFWEYLPYELFTCKQAVAIAAAISLDTFDTFRNASFSEQRRMVPALSVDHSGNTFGMAARLAWWLLKNPDMAMQEHGALATLVGCQAYGCHKAAS